MYVYSCTHVAYTVQKFMYMFVLFLVGYLFIYGSYVSPFSFSFLFWCAINVNFHVQYTSIIIHVATCVYIYIFLGKVTALGVLCCFALFVCLTLLASFFLPSHLSFSISNLKI